MRANSNGTGVVMVRGPFAVLLVAVLPLLVGCEETTTNTTDGGTTPITDGSSPIPPNDSGAGGEDGGYDCFPDPKTHLEIINRCSTSQRIDKKPTLPGLTADGGLPAIP